MDVYSFLKASEVLSLDVCKVNEENIDLWNKTYGMPRNHIKEALCNLKNIGRNSEVLQGFQQALRAETRIVQKILDGKKFLGLFEKEKIEDYFLDKFYSETKGVVVLVSDYFSEVESIIEANPDKEIFVFLLKDKEQRYIQNVHCESLRFFYGLMQILYFIVPYIKEREYFEHITIYVNNELILSDSVGKLCSPVGCELFWSIAYQTKFLKEYLDINVFNKLQINTVYNEKDIVWDELLYRKLEGLSKRKYTTKNRNIKTVAFYNYKKENRKEVLNYPHSWVGEQLSKPIKNFKNQAYKYDMMPVCSEEDRIECFDFLFFWEWPSIEDRTLLRALEVGKYIILCATESVGINSGTEWVINTLLFDAVMTWRENVLHNQKIFYMPPVYFEPILPLKRYAFEQRRKMVLIGSILLKNNIPNSLYHERYKIITWMEKNHPGELDFYGRNSRNTLNNFRSYKGYIENKIETLAQYRYCICFENNCGHNGYVSEKIFDCIFAECVPIYLGAPDINRYIPEDCFIDMRKFHDYDELYAFIENIDDKQWNEYICAMKKFAITLLSQHRYDGEAMAHDINEAIRYIEDKY